MSQDASKLESLTGSSHKEKATLPDSENRAQQVSGFKAYVPALLLLIAGLVALIVATYTSGPANGQYIVIGAPNVSQGRVVNIVLAADGRVSQQGRFQNIIIADSERADFPDALRKAGAWIVVATPWKGGCLEAAEVGDKS